MKKQDIIKKLKENFREEGTMKKEIDNVSYSKGWNQALDFAIEIVEKGKLGCCSKCGAEKVDSQLFFYVDGNNKAITKSSKAYCKECYKLVYGEGN